MTDNYWEEETLWIQDAKRMSNLQLTINYLMLEATLNKNNETFQIYTLKRLKTNEQREFIDMYYATMRLARVIQDEINYRKVLLGL